MHVGLETGFTTCVRFRGKGTVYLYIYTYMCVCVDIPVSLYIYIYIFIFIFTFILGLCCGSKTPSLRGGVKKHWAAQLRN